MTTAAVAHALLRAASPLLGTPGFQRLRELDLPNVQR
jgi:hypothetical protein